MKHIGLVTCSQYPRLTESDSLLIKPLSKRGIAVEPIVWSSPPPTLTQFDAIIVRSAWDYHTNINKFYTFLHLIKQSNVPLYNPLDILLWNSNKSYLLDLSKRGASIVPTIFVTSYDDTVFSYIRQWKEIVIKPTIGASAFGIHKLKTSNKHAIKNIINNMVKTSGVLIQPFMKEIHEGEISFMFFNKQFSHAVLKKPKETDFRTQPEFGGTETRIYPNDQLLREAYTIIEKIKDPLLYARLDGIVVNGKLLLLELELIEPDLFLDMATESVAQFTDATTHILTAH